LTQNCSSLRRAFSPSPLETLSWVLATNERKMKSRERERERERERQRICDLCKQQVFIRERRPERYPQPSE
jgi:hypothetical protein